MAVCRSGGGEACGKAEGCGEGGRVGGAVEGRDFLLKGFVFDDVDVGSEALVQLTVDVMNKVILR